MLDEQFKKYLDESYKDLFVETEDGTTLPSFEIIDRTVEINTVSDPSKKIEQFARICYRSEDRIGDNSAKGLIDFCMKRDHGSIFEHYYLSVFIPGEGNFKEVMGDEHLSPRRVWDACDCVVKRKHTFQYWDRYIQVNPSIPVEENMHWSCVAGSIRAWHSLLVPGLEASVKEDIYPALVLHTSLLKELNKVAPDFFDDIVEWFNTMLKNVVMCHGSKAVDKLTDGLDKEDLTLDAIPAERLNTGIVIHEAEGAYASFILITDRADSHQIVRHRVDCSYSQESQRYCDYGKRGVRMVAPQIEPVKFDKISEEDKEFMADEWVTAMGKASNSYLRLRKTGLDPELARSVLPNSAATKIGISMSYMALEHFFNRRLADDAQYSIRITAAEMLKQLIDTHHPVMGNISTSALLRWCKWLIEQKCIIGGLEYWTGVIEDTNKAIARIREERKRQEARAAEAEKLGEELRQEQLKQEAEAAKSAE